MAGYQRPVGASTATAVIVVEQQPIPPATRERFVANAHRSPDLACLGQLATQVSDILVVFLPMQLDGMEVQGRCNIGDVIDRAVAEHADRQCPLASSDTGQ